MTRYAKLFGLEKLCPLPNGHTLEYCIVDSFSDLIGHACDEEDFREQQKVIQSYSNSGALYYVKITSNSVKNHHIAVLTDIEREPLQFNLALGHEEVHLLHYLGRYDIFSDLLRYQGRDILLDGLHEETMCYLGGIASAEAKFRGITKDLVLDCPTMPDHNRFVQEAVRLYWGRS